MADKKPLVNDAGNAVEIATGDTIPIANGGTNATTKGGAVANLLRDNITIANCDNTTTETAVMTLVIPANTWLDGEDVTASIISKHKQGAGSNRTLTLKVKVNGSSETLLSTSAITSSAQEGNSRRTFNFTRIGSEIWAHFTTSAGTLGQFGSTTTAGTAAVGTISYAASGSVGRFWTGIDFTQDVTILYTVQWGAAANAATYWRTIHGRCEKS